MYGMFQCQPVRRRRPRRRLFAVAWLVTLLLSAGVAAENVSTSENSQIRRPDFSGSWEKDFARSDIWEQELRRIIFQLNQDAQLQQRRADGSPIAVTNSRRRIDQLVVNARLAEMISRQPGMDILQTDGEVRIERDGDAPLICSLAVDFEQTFTSVHGDESCGWDRGQLLFEINLSEGLTIQHRFSVDPGREQMRLQTTVNSRNAVPFRLVSFFNRYDPRSGGFECVQTLTQGRVCSTNSSGE